MPHWCNLAAKESGLECTCVNNDNFTALVSEDGRDLWVSMCTVQLSHSKWVSRETNLHQFCVKLELSSAETIWKCQKAQVRGKWWLAASLEQCAQSYIMFLAEIFSETSNHPGDSASLSLDLVSCGFWLFPKLKSPLKRKRFQTVNEIQENTMRQLMAIGKTVWGPKMLTLKGTKMSLSYVQCFLYIASSSVNVYFS